MASAPLPDVNNSSQPEPIEGLIFAMAQARMVASRLRAPDQARLTWGQLLEKLVQEDYESAAAPLQEASKWTSGRVEWLYAMHWAAVYDQLASHYSLPLLAAWAVQPVKAQTSPTPHDPQPTAAEIELGNELASALLWRAGNAPSRSLEAQAIKPENNPAWPDTVSAWGRVIANGIARNRAKLLAG